MLEMKVTIELLKALCKCDEAESFRCPNCQISEVLKHSYSEMEKYRKRMEYLQKKQKMFRESARTAQTSSNRYVEALKFYWHKSHRDCPCLENKSGKCKSPYYTIKVIEPAPRMSREEEVEAIEEFLRKRNGAKNQNNRHN